MAFLGSVIRDSLLACDASSKELPVYSLQGLVGAAIQDDGPMHRFFHSLASNATGADRPPAQWDQYDRTTNRAIIGGFVGLEILRKLNCRTCRYPFHDWMATILDAVNVPSLVKNLLVRLVLSSYEKADFTILNDRSVLPLG